MVLNGPMSFTQNLTTFLKMAPKLWGSNLQAQTIGQIAELFVVWNSLKAINQIFKSFKHDYIPETFHKFMESSMRKH